jgi:hypothetical protein
LFNVHGLALVGKGRIAGDDEAARDPREVGGQVVGDPVDETFQIRVVREVGKRQHDDREPRRDGRNSGLVSILLLAHIAGEADTLADDRAYQPLLLAIVADHAARGTDTARKRRFRDDPSAPDRSQQIVLAEHPIAVSDEEFQEIENLRFDRQQRGPSAQLAPLRVENVIFEQIQQFNCSRRMSARRRRDHLNSLWMRKKSRRSQECIKAASKQGGEVGGIYTR